MRNISRKMIVLIILILSILVVVAVYRLYFNRVTQFGYLKLGEVMPYTEGYNTFAPIYEIPKSKFYIAVGEPDLWCIQEDCGEIGEYVKNLGGWISGEDVERPTTDEIFAVDIEGNEDIKKIILIGDGESRLVGIYPNKGIDDVEEILRIHSDLLIGK